MTTRLLASTIASRSPGATSSSSPYLIRAVGALTSKPYAFQTRSWELKSTESVCALDGEGANIRIDTRGEQIMRVIPRVNMAVNEEWLSDRSRFSYDGLQRQRLSTPMARGGDGELRAVSWENARESLQAHLMALEEKCPGGYEAHAVIGPAVDVEAALALRAQFYRWFPKGEIHVQEQAKGVPTDERHAYIFNAGFEGIESADAVLLVGADPRKEAPLLNSRIRKAVLYNRIPVASVGCVADCTYPVSHLGSTSAALVAIADGSHPYAATLAEAKRPAIIVSNRALQRADGAAIFKLVEDIARASGAVGGEDGNWDGVSVLQNAANTVGLLDIGFESKNKASTALAKDGSWAKTKFLFLLGADDIDNLDLPEDAIVVYQGHHGDRGASRASIVLPGAAYTEKEATYVNMEGRVQRSKLAFFPPGLARNDDDILKDLIGPDLALQSSVDERPAPGAELLAPHLLEPNTAQTAHRIFGADSVFVGDEENTGLASLLQTPFNPPVENFYMTDPVTRSSKVMSKCTRAHVVDNFIGK